MTVDRAEVLRAVALLCEPGAVYELRAPQTRRATQAGYFDDVGRLAAAAARLSGQVPGVYVTLHPVRPELLARASNRVEGYAKLTTSDGDVVSRRWLPVDFDPARPAGISSTDAEHEAALDRARACREWLVAFGCARESILVADSGNGGHVLVRVDLPNDAAATALVRRCLEALALVHGDADVKVDSTVHNAARIWKVYGTMAAKGDATADRRHRLARLLEVPDAITPAPRSLLERLAATAPNADQGAHGPGGTPRPDFDVRAWLARYGLAVRHEKPWQSGATVLELAVCPFNTDHTGSAVVIVEPSGRLLFRCLHESCTGKRWADVRAMFEPDTGRGRARRARQGADDAPWPDDDDARPAAGGAGPEPGRDGHGGAPRGEAIWSRAVTAKTFLAGDDPALDWLIPRILSQGSLTNFFSPRGLGKTHVAYAHAVELARRGMAVLLLDRDNSRREIRRRLRAWGAADLELLKVMTRDDVPPLTDAAAWRTFPFGAYQLVIVDSLDASSEGVGEQDSAKPAKAIAPLLDLAHRADGPAILILGNTIKSGAYGRGSGVLEDRCDLVYEVRDATDFQPTGTKPWWTELPAAGRDAFAERATRRQHRDRHVLAFVSSKFRIGVEPEPFALEIDLSSEPWQLREVTDELAGAGAAARAAAAAQQAAAEVAVVSALVAEVTRRATRGDVPLTLGEAVVVLTEAGAARNGARRLIDEHDGRSWRTVKDATRTGHPTLVIGVNERWPRETGEEKETRASRDRGDDLFSRPCAAGAGDKGEAETLGGECPPSGFPLPAATPDSPGALSDTAAGNGAGTPTRCFDCGAPDVVGYGTHGEGWCPTCWTARLEGCR